MNVCARLMGLALLGLSSAAVANPDACAPQIERPWIRAAPPGVGMLAGYAVVRNPCASAQTITGVATAEFGSAMIHETMVVDGVSKMRHAPALRIPARAELRLAPGGRHLMLMQPKRALKPGSKVRLSLLLSDGQRISADFPVQREPPP